jgi:hypothetical protein
MLQENPLRGSELFPVLSRALEGSAAHWLTQVLVNKDVTWPVLGELFVTRFGGKETAASALTKVFREQPLKNESPGAYGNRLHSLLKARWQDLTETEIINGTILYRLSSEDRRFKRLALASDIKTEEQFRKEMSVFSTTRGRCLRQKTRQQAPKPNDASYPTPGLTTADTMDIGRRSVAGE